MKTNAAIVLLAALAGNTLAAPTDTKNSMGAYAKNVAAVGANEVDSKLAVRPSDQHEKYGMNIATGSMHRDGMNGENPKRAVNVEADRMMRDGGRNGEQPRAVNVEASRMMEGMRGDRPKRSHAMNMGTANTMRNGMRFETTQRSHKNMEGAKMVNDGMRGKHQQRDTSNADRINEKYAAENAGVNTGNDQANQKYPAEMAGMPGFKGATQMNEKYRAGLASFMEANRKNEKFSTEKNGLATRDNRINEKFPTEVSGMSKGTEGMNEKFRAEMAGSANRETNAVRALNSALATSLAGPAQQEHEKRAFNNEDNSGMYEASMESEPLHSSQLKPTPGLPIDEVPVPSPPVSLQGVPSLPVSPQDVADASENVKPQVDPVSSIDWPTDLPADINWPPTDTVVNDDALRGPGPVDPSAVIDDATDAATDATSAAGQGVGVVAKFQEPQN